MTERVLQGLRRPDRAALAVAAGLAVFGGVIVQDAMRLDAGGGYSQVGPGTVPEVIGFGLIGLAIWTAIAALRGDFPSRPHQAPGPVLWIVGGLLAQLLLLNVAGFSIATGLLFAFTARGFGKRNLALTIPVGILFSFVVWAVFSQILQLNLPTGPIERAVLGLFS
jgi:putative tricarboxylic transport membrane protein